MSSESHIGEDLGAVPSSLALPNDAEICAEWSHIVDRRWSIFLKCGKTQVVNLLDSRLSKADFYTNLLCAISSRNRVGPAWPWLSWRPGLPCHGPGFLGHAFPKCIGAKHSPLKSSEVGPFGWNLMIQQVTWHWATFLDYLFEFQV